MPESIIIKHLFEVSLHLYFIHSIKHEPKNMLNVFTLSILSELIASLRSPTQFVADKNYDEIKEILAGISDLKLFILEVT